MRLSWDNLRILLAAEQSGSLVNMAQRLGVDPTTASRRMKAIEQDLGLSLFVRSHGGLSLTQEAQQLLPHAKSMQAASRALELSARRLHEAPSGLVRISAPPTIARTVIAPSIGVIRAQAPRVCIELDTEPLNVRLQDFSTDIAIRLGEPKGLPDTLIVRKLGELEYAVFEPAKPYSLSHWIAYSERFDHVPEAAFVQAELAGEPPVMRSNDPMAMLLAVKSGAGRTVLPLALANLFGDAIKVGAPVLTRSVWALRHPENASTSAVQCVSDWLAGLLQDTA